jgi:uncharacterized protein
MEDTPMGNDPKDGSPKDDTPGQRPESLLPYDDWTEAALRQVVVRALEHVVANGLPGGHHFYISFRTDHPNAVLPKRLRAQYPQEITIVLQHQFWDLKVDEDAGAFSVGLSFGGVPTTIHVPFLAITGFADPEVRFGLRFKPELPPTDAAEPEEAPEPEAAEPEASAPSEPPQVVSLDAFRRRTPTKE